MSLIAINLSNNVIKNWLKCSCLCLSVSQFFLCLSFFLSLSLSHFGVSGLSLYIISPSLSVSLSLSVCLSICLSSVYLSLFRFLFMSMSIPGCLSVYPSVCLFLYASLSLNLSLVLLEYICDKVWVYRLSHLSIKKSFWLCTGPGFESYTISHAGVLWKQMEYELHGIPWNHKS